VAEPLEIPIFPLPDIVFFPETVLPLHVFEPRYRRMVADCLAGDGWLAIATLRPGWEHDYQGRPPVHEVAGAGEIIQAEALSDGRYNVLVDGRCRIRIEAELPPDRPYRVARARRLGDVLRSDDTGSMKERLLTLRAAHAKLLEALGQSHADLVGRLTVAGARPAAVIDRIVSAVVPDAQVRQRVLEAVDVSQRLDLATAAVLDLLTLVAGSEGDGEGEEEGGAE
jgi:Lon protease-like protein